MLYKSGHRGSIIGLFHSNSGATAVHVPGLPCLRSPHVRSRQDRVRGWGRLLPPNQEAPPAPLRGLPQPGRRSGGPPGSHPWSHRNKGTAERFLDQWLPDAAEIDQPDLQRFARTLDEHREQILPYYDEPISTGPLEGLNKKLKVLKRVAYGYRDTEFFQLRVLFIDEVGTKVTGV